jgi:hypothetical protein
MVQENDKESYCGVNYLNKEAKINFSHKEKYAVLRVSSFYLALGTKHHLITYLWINWHTKPH